MRYFPILVGIGILVAIAISSLWLDAAGHLAPGTLVLKRELVTIDSSTWSRQFLVRVVYHMANIRPLMTDLTVNEKEFDTLHIGDTVQVRYMNLHIIRGTRLATRGTGTIIMDFFHHVSRTDSHFLRAEAQVVRTRRIDKGWFRPAFLIVQVAYTPKGYRDPVQAIDEIDPISLAPGSQVTIEYDGQFPRQVRIAGAHS